MFDLENWAEIFSSISKNKLRTFLTGFSISWGIFMFCVLLAAGNGLRNGMLSNFGNQSVHHIQFSGGITSIPDQGLPDNRRIRLDNKDLNLITTQVPEAGEVSPVLSGYYDVVYKQNSSQCTIVGTNPEYQTIKGVTIVDNQGRFINEMDMQNTRKVAVINEQMKKQLMNVPNPVGQHITINGLNYTVIGIFKENTFDSRPMAYIPYSTANLLHKQSSEISNITFSLKNLDTKEDNELFETGLREKLSVLHHFNAQDISAVNIWNEFKSYLQFLGMMNGISAFIWIIGICTLVSGMIGVSNIMLITVRERTREIGIRKALGAKPRSILNAILLESVFITFLFGYLGVFLGVGLGEWVNKWLQSPEVSEEVAHAFLNPTIQVPVALGALLILIISGFLAGYFPALKAVQISPVEAMRSE
ncbi:ABC transporter permease [Bacteroidia bacterium]|nr:ABC transporter permease [Bacteroidia bacterium]